MKHTVTTFGVALAFGLVGTVGAFASTIDLTDNGSYYQGTTAADPATGTEQGVVWTISPRPKVGPLTYTAFDGDSLANNQAANPDLAFENDGIGITDDEVTYPRESLVMTFSEEVTVTGVYVLDLFGDETVEIYDGTTLLYTIDAMSAVDDNSLDGYSYIEFSTGVKTTSLTFKSGPLNDSGNSHGKPDFALAAVTLAPIPVPAAGLLLLGGLGALGAAKRRKA